MSVDGDETPMWTLEVPVVAETPLPPRVRERGPARPLDNPSSPTELPVPSALPSPTSPAADEDESEDEVKVAPPRRFLPVGVEPG